MLVYPLPQRARKLFAAARLCHIDTYRLSRVQELLDIGIKDYLGDTDTICVIEWPQKMKKVLPPGTIQVDIKMNS
jgi:tRNA threonylcarbamoyladenosine biosynthesis protein TsaE